jgi:GNAT superfamily N-acetyltransferase
MSGSISVRPVNGRREFRRFIDYAYERHASDPHWIAPLRMAEHERLTPRRNPFFMHADVELFLAWREGLVVGRIAAIDDRRHNQVHAENTAMFGFFEAADRSAAHVLLRTVESWAAEHGRDTVRGPVNPSMNESAGLLVEGFDTDPMLLMPHNPPEYGEYLESAGYSKAKDLFAWRCDLDRDLPPIVERLAQRVRQRKAIRVRPICVSEFVREADRIHELYCLAWAHNWGFVPPTREEFHLMAKGMKPIFDVRLAVCAEVDGRTVACAIALPDVNQALKGTDGRLRPRAIVRLLRRKRYIDQARLLLLGVLPQYRTRGLYPLLLSEFHRQVRDGPYRRAELSWVLEDNRNINRAAEQAGARLAKRYRIYQKALVA